MPRTQTQTNEITELWTTDETAAFLRVSVATIYSWRYQRKGPQGHRLGRRIVFVPEEVRAWVLARD